MQEKQNKTWQYQEAELEEVLMLLSQFQYGFKKRNKAYYSTVLLALTPPVAMKNWSSPEMTAISINMSGGFSNENEWIAELNKNK